MATLKNLVDETTNIKNELKTCHTNLKNNLVEKGVEISSRDKLSTLVDKVGEIKQAVKIIASDEIQIYSDTETLKGSSKDTDKYIFHCVGSARCSFKFKSNTTQWIDAYITLYNKDGISKEQASFRTNGSYLTAVKDFENIELFDYVIFSLSTHSYAYGYDRIVSCTYV